jgi:dCMP deaminase
VSSPSSRPTWDEHWIDAARNAAKRSLCSRDQVGAVIVNTRREIVATGYNGPPAGFEHDDKPCRTWCARAAGQEGLGFLTVVGKPVPKTPAPDLLDPAYGDCPSLHAEANALMMSDKTRRYGGTLYVNSHVCFSCAKLIANSGLRRAVVAPSQESMHRTPSTGYALLNNCGLDVHIIEEFTL